MSKFCNTKNTGKIKIRLNAEIREKAEMVSGAELPYRV